MYDRVVRDMNNRKDKSLFIPILILMIVLVASVLYLCKPKSRLTPQDITSFDDCARAGYPIMESYPERCRTPDGRSFTKQLPLTNDLQRENMEEIGLSFEHPKDLVYRKEIADDNGRIRTAGFFLTKGADDKPEYQLYGLYIQFQDATEQDLELAKREMDPATIKEASIDGYKGVEGLILGPKTRWITVILKGNKLFTVSTSPPTQDNKDLTDKMLSTFKFQSLT